MKNTNQRIVICCSISAVLGLFPLPYPAYILLRALFFFSLMYSCWITYKKTMTISPIIVGLLGLAILYNPIFLVHLGNKAIWTVINFATIAILVWTLKPHLNKIDC
jgi:hypothetical protein